jgi:hypothetical protein
MSNPPRMADVSRRKFIAGTAALGLLPLASRLPGAGAAGGAILQVVRVRLTDPSQSALLNGFDVLCGQHHAANGVDVLLWPGDGARLRAKGLAYDIVVPDVAAMDRSASSGSVAAASVQPGQRDDYRRLADYEADLHRLAQHYSDRARVITLPEKTLEGRTVYGIEIAGNVARRDGRPVFYLDGLHHAREWPSGEMAIMFAHDLVEGYATDARIRGLVDRVRTIIVPVVNADGFHYSREAVMQMFPTASVEGYWRKNRRTVSGVDKPGNPDAYGVDPNRNYLFGWGGEGASDVPADQTYRGGAPFSEPEARNVRSVVSSNAVTAAISNHTSGQLILRPWGHTWDDCPDEPTLRALGDAMARCNGYTSQKGMGLYVTTGTADDWMYAAFGTLGYTFEHGIAFHPPYADAVPGAYPGNREAYLLLLQAAADPAHHGGAIGRVVSSSGARVAANLRVAKTFATPATAPGRFTDVASITSVAGSDGTFELHLNPSTRPVATSVESYNLVVTAPGFLPAGRSITVARGQRVDLGQIVLHPA